MNDSDHPIPNNQDYGHARALIDNLERWERDEPELKGQARVATKQLESSDFKCRECGATMRVTKDVWPKESACEHSFSTNYGIVVDVASDEG